MEYADLLGFTFGQNNILEKGQIQIIRRKI